MKSKDFEVEKLSTDDLPSAKAIAENLSADYFLA
jgi:hypothetical protein